MHTENAIVIRADIDAIYRLAAAVEDWPSLLPHYRWVRVLRPGEAVRLVEMAAHRDGFPVWWQAEQWRDPATPRIRFRHVRGVTTGMEVEWRFTPLPEGVRVTIDHQLTLGWPLIGRFAAERIIGPHFVEHIAGQTLRHIKELAEGQAGRAPAATGQSRAGESAIQGGTR
jgi:uncharacterized membrane protein